MLIYHYITFPEQKILTDPKFLISGFSYKKIRFLLLVYYQYVYNHKRFLTLKLSVVVTFLGPRDIVGKVVMVEILPHVLQPVQQVAGLPHKILQGLKWRIRNKNVLSKKRILRSLHKIPLGLKRRIRNKNVLEKNEYYEVCTKSSKAGNDEFIIKCVENSQNLPRPETRNA